MAKIELPDSAIREVYFDVQIARLDQMLAMRRLRKAGINHMVVDAPAEVRKLFGEPELPAYDPFSPAMPMFLRRQAD